MRERPPTRRLLILLRLLFLLLRNIFKTRIFFNESKTDVSPFSFLKLTQEAAEEESGKNKANRHPFLSLCLSHQPLQSLQSTVTLAGLTARHRRRRPRCHFFHSKHAAGGNRRLPSRPHHWDVCVRPGPGFQGCVGPLRRLLEPDQPEVSERASERFCSVLFVDCQAASSFAGR